MSENDTDRARWQVRMLGDGRFIFSGTFKPEDFNHFLGIPIATSSRVVPSPLINIPAHLPSGFYSDLIKEINMAYSYFLYTSTYVCLRKLFENLVIELLRTRYGTAELPLYYDANRGRFQDFSILLDNLRGKSADFRQYTTGIDDHFFSFITDLRERANSNAHSIDVIREPKYFEDNKDMLNQYIVLLCDVHRRI
jgi:hypothetical protein